VDVPGLSHTCFIDVPYLKRYGTYTGHIRDIYGASLDEPWQIRGLGPQEV
jgi:hypothetical protein